MCTSSCRLLPSSNGTLCSQWNWHELAMSWNSRSKPLKVHRLLSNSILQFAYSTSFLVVQWYYEDHLYYRNLYHFVHLPSDISTSFQEGERSSGGPSTRSARLLKFLTRPADGGDHVAMNHVKLGVHVT